MLTGWREAMGAMGISEWPFIEVQGRVIGRNAWGHCQRNNCEKSIMLGRTHFIRLSKQDSDSLVQRKEKY